MSLRRTLAVFVLAALCSSAASAWIWPLPKKKKNQNPLANVNSQQPDKVLFDRGEDALGHSKYDVARLTFQTLINTYPDSEYVARAKLGIGDAWYKEGGTTALAQAEIEYKDFITFFPNMPEAAEAQLKVANIHYRQMEKPDRDYTHAKRAEEEYRQLILQFPDSKLVPTAEQRLREVQEVLAAREFEIGRFYYLRESYPAAQARLKTLVDSYPLFSQIDEALYMLGSSYEHEVENLKNRKLTGGYKQMNEAARAKLLQMNEAARARMIKSFEDQAAAAYARIITQYPAMDRVDDAKHRLAAMGRKVPQPTQQAMLEDKKIENSRSESGRFSKLMGNFRHAPDVSESAKVGQPTLQDPVETSAVTIVRDTTAVATGTANTGNNTVTIQTLKPDEANESQPVPKSDQQLTPEPQAQQAPDNSGAAQPQTGSSQPASAEPTASQPEGAQTNPASQPPSSSDEGAIPELKPLDNSSTAQPTAAQPAGTPQAQSATGASTPSSTPTAAQEQAPPPPAQVNDVNSGSTSTDQAQSSDQSSSNNADSSSKKKKKKGLRKLVPF